MKEIQSVFKSVRAAVFILSAVLAFQFLLTDTAKSANPPTAVTFVQISDIHINPNDEDSKSRMKKDSVNLLDDAIGQINEMKDVDFVIFTGDLGDKSDEKLLTIFAQTASKLKVPWYWTTGNHDIAVGGNSKARFREILNSYNKSNQHETMCYSFKKGDFIFFAMDGTDDKKGPSLNSLVGSPEGIFSRECLDMLEKELTANAKSPAVVFQHFPLVYPMQSFDHGVKNKTEYLKLLDSHPNVKAVFAGHFHVTKVAKRKNILHIASPALIEYPNAFRLVKLEETAEGVSVDIKTINTRLSAVREESKKDSPAAAQQEGQPEDRTFSEVLK